MNSYEIVRTMAQTMSDKDLVLYTSITIIIFFALFPRIASFISAIILAHNALIQMEIMYETASKRSIFEQDHYRVYTLLIVIIILVWSSLKAIRRVC
jgi:hypothetical protein